MLTVISDTILLSLHPAPFRRSQCEQRNGKKVTNKIPTVENSRFNAVFV